jgi:hypothetical protein
MVVCAMKRTSLVRLALLAPVGAELAYLRADSS